MRSSGTDFTVLIAITDIQNLKHVYKQTENAVLNKCVLRCRLKRTTGSIRRRLSGKSFHKCGAFTEKPRRPKPTSCGVSSAGIITVKAYMVKQ